MPNQLPLPSAPYRSHWQALLLLLLLVLSGCSKDSKNAPKADEPAPSSSNGVHIVRLAPSSAPPFLVAFDDEEHAVVFFATKDVYGNPVTVTGFGLIYDDTYLRIERDTQGRPKLIATPDERLLFGRYADGAVRVDHLSVDAPPTSMTLNYSDEQLAAMTVPLPSLDFVEKAADGSFFKQLYDLAKPYVDTLRAAKGCGEGLAEGLLKDLEGGLKSRAGVLGAAFECANDLLPRPAAEKLKVVLDALLQAAVTGVDAVKCAASVATTPTGAGIPLALYECGMALYSAFELGQKIGEAINAFTQDDPYDPRDLTDGSFFLVVDGKLTAKTRADVSVTLQLNGDKKLSTAVADLSEIGGPSAAPLQHLDGQWTWSGSVTPPVEGGFQLRLSVDSGEFFPAGGGYVSAPSPISVDVSASAPVVSLGESVTLTATVRGGEPPYESAWAINDQVGHDNEDTITDAPQARSHYAFAVQDASRALPYFMTSDIWVAVCGDGECSPEENAAVCAADCRGASGAGGAGNGEGGAAAAGNGGGSLNAGGVGDSNSGGLGGVSVGGDGGTVTPGGGSPSVTKPNAKFAGITNGDPHLHTFDRLLYDLQAVGELTLVQDKADGMEVQVRTHPYGTSSRVAVNEAVAARVGTQRVAWYIDGRSTLDGVPTPFTSYETALEGGGKIYRPSAGLHVVHWPDGSELHVIDYGLFLRADVYLSDARREKMLGLLGNFDGSQANELLTRAGVGVPSPADFETFYNVFAESWRVTQADSLFDYGAGETTETFTDRSFPRRLLRVVDLDAAAAAQAKQLCQDRGVTDPGWLDACTLDVAESGDSNFADYYGDVPVAEGALEVKPPLVSDADNGGALGLDRLVTGTLVNAEQHFYSFSALAGEGVQVRVADLTAGSFVPSVKVYDAQGKLIASTYSAEVAWLSFAAPASGLFTIVVSDRPGTAMAADYALYFTKAPGAAEGGALSSGGVVRGTIDKGDLDSYTFSANTGEGIQLRVADIDGTSFVPAMAIYDPQGKLVSSTYSQDVAWASFSAPSSGTYTVVAYDWSSGAASNGDYDLYFARAPSANEGGGLVNGGVTDGTIDLGDLDSYTFSVNTGEGVQLRVADIDGTSFVPAMAVYDPQGKLVDSSYSQSVTWMSFSASQTGTYTLVVYDWSSGAASTGDYKLYFTRAPGASANGALNNGGVNEGTIELGELDSYAFTASAGEGVQLRVADIDGISFVPAMAVYDPLGKLVVSSYAQDVAHTSFSATSSGTYSVVIYDWSSGAASIGNYRMYFTRAPGAAEGGVLENGSASAGTIDLGDLDSYTFAAGVGEGIQLRIADATGTSFVPAFAVYDPQGDLVTSAYSQDVAHVSFSATSGGTYTVVVYDWSSGAASSGDYELYFAKAPGANRGGELTSGVPTTGSIGKGELDSYTLSATKGQTFQLTITDTAAGPLVPAVAVYAPDGALLNSGYGADTVTLSFTASTTGTYTVLAYDWSSGTDATGSYQLALLFK